MANIDLKGLDNVLNLIESVGQDVNIEQALEKCCVLVEREAKQLAPKGSGELRRSITSEVQGTKGIIFTPLEYAPYVEFGTGLFAEQGGRTDVPWVYKDDEGEWHSTSGMKPHPFMRPALENNRNKIIQTLKGAITNND